MAQYDFTVYHTSTGEVIARNTVTHLYQLESGVPDGPYTYVLGEAPKDHYVDPVSEEFVVRPTIPAFVNPYDLTLLPAGTEISVTDESKTETLITELTDSLTLVGPQTYQIKINPPFPYMPMYVTDFEVV